MKSWNDPNGALPDARSCSSEWRDDPFKKRCRRFMAMMIPLSFLSTFWFLGIIRLPFVPSPILTSGNRPQSTAASFEWSSIEAKEDLEFHSCFNDFQCSKLKLPLDYFNGTYTDSTISLAIAKLPARVPIDDPRYGGPILINPGGPGGSGVFLALAEARSIQYVVDSKEDPDLLLDSESKHNSSAKYFDIIGFDPRGIAQTEPQATCLADTPSSWSWRLRESNEGILESSDATLGRLWSMDHALGASCKMSVDAEDEPDIKQYMTTAYVARDMLELVEKHAEFEAAEAMRLAAASRSRCSRREATTFKPNTAKLQYWGYSYGTYLGATFSSMFPDRVGRVVLDGVVNSDDYNASLGQGSLHDNEKAMLSFYTFCLQAGPETCPLAIPGSTIEDLELRVKGIVQKLYHSPLQINSAEGPEVLEFSDIKAVLFSALYSPQAAFSLIANILAAIDLGAGQILDDLAQAFRYSHTYTCPINGTSAPKLQYDVPEISILCGDGDDQTGESIEEFEKYWHELLEISPTSGSIWATLRLKCASWKIKPMYRYTGEFGGKTSHPILFVSNTADNVTPLRSGRIMSSRFPGSALLIQDSAGHCSLSTPTICTLNYIRQYFQEGTLPPPENLCVPPPSAFSLNSTDPDSPFYDHDLTLGVLGMAQEYWDALPDELHTPEVIRKFLSEAAQRSVKEEDLANALTDEEEFSLYYSGWKLQQWMSNELPFFPMATRARRDRVQQLLTPSRRIIVEDNLYFTDDEDADDDFYEYLES